MRSINHGARQSFFEPQLRLPWSWSRRPGVPAELIRVINTCFRGAPFDLEATPNLAARLAEAGWSWPPPRLFDYPAKKW